MNRKAILITLAVVGVVGGYWWWRSSRTVSPSIPGTIPGKSIPGKQNLIEDVMTETNLMIKSLGNPGIRNNNPLNIRPDANSRRDPWLGQVGERDGYIVFSKPEYGFRAGARTLRTYASKGVNTIAAIAERWAPKEDGNDPVAYANFISKRTGILGFTPVDPRNYPIILQAMAKMETGKEYPIDIVLKGVGMVDLKS